MLQKINFTLIYYLINILVLDNTHKIYLDNKELNIIKVDKKK